MTSSKILVRDVRQSDFAKWKPLWDGYNLRVEGIARHRRQAVHLNEEPAGKGP